MRRLFVAAFILATSSAMALLAATPTPDKVYDIANLLSGTFEGSTPGNQLTLDLRPVTIDPQHPYDLFLQVMGKFQNDNVRQQGVMRLEQQGQDVYLTYIPHFTPAVTSLSNDAGRFSESELSSACSFVVKPRGDGFFGDTLGSAVCARAMRGAVGKWTIEIEPGNIRVRNTESGETLRFRQVSKGKK
jgi:hypothetical protein